MPQLSEAQWAEMKAVWESTVDSKSAKAKLLGNEYGVHPNTVKQKARDLGWHDPVEGEDEKVEEIRAAVEDVAPDWLDVEAKNQMTARILELERELAAANAKVDDLRPDTDVRGRLFDTVDEVIEWLGTEHIEELAMGEMANVNRQRIRRGHPGLTREEMMPTPEQIQNEARKILAERRNGMGAPPYRRAVTMVKPEFDGCAGFDDNGSPKACYRHGHMVKIPLEGQINNMRGSMFDATHRYTAKGFKLTNPLVCLAGPCWEPAAVDVRGKPVYRGYCSDAHFKGTPAEHGEDRQVVGTITSQNVMA